MSVPTFGDARSTATPLVGRRLELNWLRHRHALALRGYAHLVLVEGDAGIGKSRLVQEFLAEVRRGGTTVVRGRCYEHIDLAYLPLRESLFATMAQRLAARGAPADELTLLNIGTADDDATASTTSPEAADRARSERLLALTRLVIDFARREPVVVLVDDLDWADAATVDLLRHLLFRFDDEEVPLLVVATSRVDAQARAASALARLRLEPRVATVVLQPLSELEAVELAHQRLPRGAGVERARQLAAAGGGNPLLVESLAHQTQRGLTTSAPPGRTDAAHPVTASIAGRLAALDPDDRRALQVTAFLGPQATVDLISEVAELAPAAIDAALTTAIEHDLVVDEPGVVTFTHPLVAHSLFQQTRGPAARDLHARIASILRARHEAGDEVQMRALAHHLIGAAERAEARDVAEYAELAGDEAMTIGAWGEAARCYEAALSACRASLDTDGAVRLHRAAALAHRGEMALEEAEQHLAAAIELLGDDGDPAVIADLHVWRMRCSIGSQALLHVVRDRAPLEALTEQLERDHPDLAAEALVELSQSYWVDWEIERSAETARRAMRIAEEAGSSRAFVRATTTLCVPQWAQYDLIGSLATLERGVGLARAAGDDSLLVGGPLFRVPLVLAWLGRHDEAVAYAEEGLAVAERAHYPLEEGLPRAALAQIAVARGAFADAEQHAHQALLVQRLSGYNWAAGLYLPAQASAYVATGRFAAADDALATWEEVGSEVDRAACALFRRYVAAHARELAVAGEPLPRLPRAVTIGLDAWAAACIEIARREGLHDGVQRAHDVLAEVDRLGGVFTSSIVALVPRVLGVARDLLGDEVGAVDTLRRAIAVADVVHAAAEGARARVDLAAILQRRGDRREAAELVDEAMLDLDRLDMAPDAARAAALLGDASPHAGGETSTVERAHTVILFSDVVESTRLTEELGAVGYRRLARQVEELVTSTITAHGGTIVTGISLGDGFIGLFPAVEPAVQAARRCAAGAGTTGLHLHLALHRGEILVDGARIYGGPVNYAARLCALSGPDEILVSDTIRDDAAGIEGVSFLDRGLHDFKGFTGAQPVSALVDDTRDEEPEFRSRD